MPSLLTDSNSIPVPQYLKEDSSAYEASRGRNGGFDTNIIEPIVAIGDVDALPASLVNSVDGAAIAATAANGLLVDISRVQGEVLIKDSEELAAVVSAGAASTSTASPNDTTTFPDITGNAKRGVQVYASSTANIVALIIEAKIGSTYYPLLIVVPHTAAPDALTLVAVLSPKFNGVLTAAWRIKMITVTATTPTIAASYQYID